MPYSVTIQSTSFLLVVTMAPSFSVGLILLMVPLFPVEVQAMKDCPPLD